MILADYRCGCTWVGAEHEMPDQCARHHAAGRRAHQIGEAGNVEKGWCWELPAADEDGARQLARAV